MNRELSFNECMVIVCCLVFMAYVITLLFEYVKYKNPQGGYVNKKNCDQYVIGKTPPIIRKEDLKSPPPAKNTKSTNK